MMFLRITALGLAAAMTVLAATPASAATEYYCMTSSSESKLA
jgi:hypothetical protein